MSVVRHIFITDIVHWGYIATESEVPLIKRNI
jgi:hypothetical protein